MPELLFENLTYAIIGAAMEVHRSLGPGFLEAIYQAALEHELTLRGIPFNHQVKLEVMYKGVLVGEYRADFLIDGKVIVEIKAHKSLTEIDEAQLINYLKGTGIRVGLLINFGESSLKHVRRVV